jgi:hypothetical protein
MSRDSKSSQSSPLDFKKIEEMFPLLHAAFKEYISIDDSNHASWFSSIKFISNKIAQSLDLKNNKISNAILNKFTFCRVGEFPCICQFLWLTYEQRF